jgi:hypothetical protein
MVPSLAYHIGSDLSFLKGILDDNPVRASLKYPGLSPEISPGRDADISNETVLITALDSTEGIKRRLESIGQNRIISPVDLD